MMPSPFWPEVGPLSGGRSVWAALSLALVAFAAGGFVCGRLAFSRPPEPPAPTVPFDQHPDQSATSVD